MKCTLIVDSEGPNPAYDPPDRHDFATDEEFHDAKALYDVPPEVIVPAGTVLSGALAWVHCFPQSRVRVVEKVVDGVKKRVPSNAGPLFVRAVPADPACEAALAKHVQHAAKTRRVAASVIMDEIEQGLAAARGQQQENDKAKVMPAPAAGE